MGSGYQRLACAVLRRAVEDARGIGHGTFGLLSEPLHREAIRFLISQDAEPWFALAGIARIPAHRINAFRVEFYGRVSRALASHYRSA